MSHIPQQCPTQRDGSSPLAEGTCAQHWTARTTSIRQVAAASLIGSVVEWYDFFLYGTMAALVFNGGSSRPSTRSRDAGRVHHVRRRLRTRPIGGVLFGHLGDRLGRKPMLVVTMMIMGLSTFAMGLLPTYDAIGVAAPLLLVALRMLQGIGLGGEWGGAVLLCVEHAPAGRRGWYASWPQLGVPIGLLLSTGAVKALGRLGDDALAAGAWRIPFLASIVLVAVGLFIRLRIAEPPAFRELVDHDARSRVPLLEVLRRHPKVTLLAMGARISESVTFNVYNAFLVTYVVTVLALKNTVALNALIVAAVVGFFVILGAAERLRPDRPAPGVPGRRRPRPAVSAFPIFALFDTKNAALITSPWWSAGAFAACTMFGAEGALFAELYPTRVRYSGMSTVYQLGVLPSGAVAPIICTLLIQRFDNAAWPVATYVMAMAAITVVSLVFLPETFRRDLRAHETSRRPCPASARRSPRDQRPTAQHRPDPRRRHGLLRHRLLRRRDRHAQPRPARRRGRAVHAVLQHRPLLPLARLAAHRPVPAPGRRRHHDRRRPARRLPGRPQRPVRHDRRGPAGRRLPHATLAGKWHLSLATWTTPKRQLADAARLRPLLRHARRRRQLLRPAHADARRR